MTRALTRRKPPKAKKRASANATRDSTVDKVDERTKDEGKPPKEQRTADRADAPAARKVAEHKKDMEYRKGNLVTKPREETNWEHGVEIGTAARLEIAGRPNVDLGDGTMIKGVISSLTPLHLGNQGPVVTMGWLDVWGATPCPRGPSGANMYTGTYLIIITIRRHRVMIRVSRSVHHQKHGNNSYEGYGWVDAMIVDMVIAMLMNDLMNAMTSDNLNHMRCGGRRRLACNVLAPPQEPGRSWSKC